MILFFCFVSMQLKEMYVDFSVDTVSSCIIDNISFSSLSVNKCSDRSIEVKLLAPFLGNYDRPTSRPKDIPGHGEVSLSERLKYQKTL